MRSKQSLVNAVCVLFLVPLLLPAACGSDDSGGDDTGTSAETTTADTGGDAEDTDDEAADPVVEGDGWVIEIGEGRVVADPDRTICLRVPDGTFTANGAGDNGFGAEFFFNLGTTSGAEFSYEVAGNVTAEIGPDLEGSMSVDYDEDSGRIAAIGEMANGTPIAVSGTC